MRKVKTMIEIILIAVGIIAGFAGAGLGAINKIDSERRKYLGLLTNQKNDIMERDVIIKEQTIKIDQLIKERNLYHADYKRIYIELDSLKAKLIRNKINIKPEAYEEIEIVS